MSDIMENKRFKTRMFLQIAFNFVIFVTALIISILGVNFGSGDGQVGADNIGLGYLKPFTMDSNILAGICAAITLFYGIKSLGKGKDVLPKWVAVFYLMCSTCVLLTFLIAAVFLGPQMVSQGRNYFLMFSGDMFFFHFFNPVLSVFSFLFLLKKQLLRRRDCLFGILPTVIYSIVYFCQVVIFKNWDDWYGFTFGGQFKLIPVVVFVIYSLVFALSCFLVFLYKRKSIF